MSSPLQKFTFLAEGGFRGWMKAIDIQSFDQLTLGTSLLPVAKRRQTLSVSICSGGGAGRIRSTWSPATPGVGLGCRAPEAGRGGLLVKASLPTPYPAWEALLR